MPAAEGSHKAAVEDKENMRLPFEIAQVDSISLEILQFKIRRGRVDGYFGHVYLYHFLKDENKKNNYTPYLK